MSFGKSLDLMRLAEMAAGRRKGICVNDIVDELDVNQRTAQRMLRGLELAFPGLKAIDGPGRRRYWKLQDSRFVQMQGVRDTELAALDKSIRRAMDEGAEQDAKALASLRDRLMAALPSHQIERTEMDAEALLMMQGYACRPGPKVKSHPEIMGAISQALKIPCTIKIVYRSARDSEARERELEPCGVLLGIRPYLVARDLGNGRALRRYRIDRIEKAGITMQAFKRDPGFDLKAYAAQSFGSFHSDAEHTRIIWRFAPSAADAAREFLFHPTQELFVEPDGSLRVEFTASGWVEMAWHLYQWGDQVEVVAPEPLREMVEGFQRGDLGVMP